MKEPKKEFPKPELSVLPHWKNLYFDEVIAHLPSSFYLTVLKQIF